MLGMWCRYASFQHCFSNMCVLICETSTLVLVSESAAPQVNFLLEIEIFRVIKCVNKLSFKLYCLTVAVTLLIYCVGKYHGFGYRVWSGKLCYNAQDQGTHVSNLVPQFNVRSSSANLVIFLKLLSQKYEYFRPIERDGNCFYQAFFFSYLVII